AKNRSQHTRSRQGTPKRRLPLRPVEVPGHNPNRNQTDPEARPHRHHRWRPPTHNANRDRTERGDPRGSPHPVNDGGTRPQLEPRTGRTAGPSPPPSPLEVLATTR